MPTPIPTQLHPLAGALALLLILLFWTSTVMVELVGDHAAILAVKTWILWGMALLIPALALTGASGLRRARVSVSALVDRKRRRMPILAANGLLVLLPCAFLLQARAAAARIDGVFYAMQALELTVGLVNLTLLALMLRDGLEPRGLRMRAAA